MVLLLLHLLVLLLLVLLLLPQALQLQQEPWHLESITDDASLSEISSRHATREKQPGWQQQLNQ